MPTQRVQTNNLIEATHGHITRPTLTTNSLRPSPGSLVKAPPDVTRLIAVDYQTTTGTFSMNANTWQFITFPAVGFTGLMSSVQRFLSGSNPPTTNVANNSAPLVTGQNTQLLLLCHVQEYSPVNTLVLPNIILRTQAIENQTNKSLVGPWFPSGTTYLAFSCLPLAFAMAPGAVVGANFTIGISAELYMVFVQ